VVAWRKSTDDGVDQHCGHLMRWRFEAYVTSVQVEVAEFQEARDAAWTSASVLSLLFASFSATDLRLLRDISSA
jgi:subtilisin-like proprotein convertase family protein